ncbi:uncharacterized protein LOC100178707 [Ciona intestinalis]
MGKELESKKYDNGIEEDQISGRSDTETLQDLGVLAKDENCVMSLLRFSLPKVAGPNVSSKKTQLISACATGNLLVVQNLLQMAEVDVNEQDSEGNTALMHAAQAGFDSIVSYLLFFLHGEITVDAENNNGFTALMKAALHGKTNCARRLIIAGADVTKRDWGRGLQADEWASFCGMRETAIVIRKTAMPAMRKEDKEMMGWQKKTHPVNEFCIRIGRRVARAMHWNEEQWIRDAGSLYHLAEKAANVQGGLLTSLLGEGGNERIPHIPANTKGENVMTCVDSNRSDCADDILVVEITSPQKQRVTQRCFRRSLSGTEILAKHKSKDDCRPQQSKVPTVNVIRASPSKQRHKKTHHRANHDLLVVPKASHKRRKSR